MRKTMMLVLAALTAGVAGCDEDNVEGNLLVGFDAQEDLSGLWTGSEQVFGAMGETGALSSSGSDDGFTFPVALRLRPDATFELRTFGVQATSAGLLQGDRVCSGVWEDEGTRLEFFPDRACFALPLNRYTVGRKAPGGMILRGETELPGQTAPAVIRVHMELERD